MRIAYMRTIDTQGTACGRFGAVSSRFLDRIGKADCLWIIPRTEMVDDQDVTMDLTGWSQYDQ